MSSMMIARGLLIGFAGLALASSVSAGTLFFDDFDDGFAGWNTSGNVQSDNAPAIGANSIRLRGNGQIWRTVSTAGSTGIAFAWTLAAQSLESNDRCYVEINTGSGWTVIAQLGNGEDDMDFRSGVVNLDPAADDNPGFQVRYRVSGASADYCYAEDTTISDGGAGAGRTELTYDYLMNGTQSGNPVNDSAMGRPVGAGPPAHIFQGRLELHGEATGGDFVELRDDFLYTGLGDHPRKHLPEFDFELVQDVNGALIPVRRGNVNTSHPNWTWILGPGEVWSEADDNGMSRASFPFALVQRNSNCTHNGTMTFLFDDMAASKVHYQITQETCLYFKFNQWGLLSATYHAQAVAGAAQIQADFATELADRMVTKPFAELANDYPGTDLNAFGAGITPEHMSTYGLVIGAVNYTAACGTRYGQYPYCAWMRLPSYSTAKSFFAGVAMMALAEQYDAGIYDLLIKDYVPEYANADGEWSSVTLEHASDMVVGNYQSSLFLVDESSATMDNEFFLVATYADKIAGAFTWPNKARAGTSWVYHTGDTFILVRALQNYLEAQAGSGADIFEYLVERIFQPLKLGPGAHTSLRTSDNNWTGQAFGGYGLWFVQDDVAKLASFLAVDRGAIGGTQRLEPSGLDAALQSDPADRGHASTGNDPRMYNNGFWARNFTLGEGYACDFWVPFASGYGGITVAMMPNGMTYYYFSDNDEFEWTEAIAEVDRSIASLDSGPYCTSGGGSDTLHVGDIAMATSQFGGNRWRAQAAIAIIDADGTPVEGVIVDRRFTGATNSSPGGTTDVTGRVTLVSGKKKNGGTWTFCVDALSKGGWNYDPGANVETCDNVSAPP